MNKDFGDIGWLSEELGVKEGVIRRLVRSGKIPFSRLTPTIIRFNKSEVIEYLKSNKIGMKKKKAKA